MNDQRIIKAMARAICDAEWGEGHWDSDALSQNERTAYEAMATDALAAYRKVAGDEIAALLERAEKAERERGEYRNLLIRVVNEGTDGYAHPDVSLDFLKHVPKEVAAVKRERDEARKQADEREEARLGHAARTTSMIDRLKAENAHLRVALLRARTVLGNMAMERPDATFFRWIVPHEPLRADAKELLPVIDTALGQEDEP